MPTDRADLLVSPAWLRDHLRAPDVVVADASMHLKVTGRDARAEYLAGHVPGAVFFDIDDISDPDSGLPHTLPSPERFASRMRRLGIGDGMRIVVYDTVGLYSAPRARWMFKVMGARDVVVLDGGLPAFVAAGGALEEGEVSRPPRHFTARLDHSAVRDLAAMRRIVSTGEAQVVDARSRGRFTGEAPEPREGLPSGHMPGARNVPFDLLSEDGRLRDAAAIRRVFADAGVDVARPVVTTCGSGVTAAVLSLALEAIGARAHTLYDGSWSEWASTPGAPVVTGEADRNAPGGA